MDIGHGVSAELREIAGVAMGVAYWHDCITPARRSLGSEDYCPIDDGPKGWTLVSRDPLTISPSLLCRACGHHGFIRDGKWVPA